MENSPHPYPSPVKIYTLSSKKHTIFGRRLEILILVYAVDLFRCCGRVQPSQIYIKLPNNTFLDWKHRMNNYALAWKCNDQRICRGLQFFLQVHQLK